MNYVIYNWELQSFQHVKAFFFRSPVFVLQRFHFLGIFWYLPLMGSLNESLALGTFQPALTNRLTITKMLNWSRSTQQQPTYSHDFPCDIFRSFIFTKIINSIIPRHYTHPSKCCAPWFTLWLPLRPSCVHERLWNRLSSASQTLSESDRIRSGMACKCNPPAFFLPRCSSRPSKSSKAACFFLSSDVVTMEPGFGRAHGIPPMVHNPDVSVEKWWFFHCQGQ